MSDVFCNFFCKLDDSGEVVWILALKIKNDMQQYLAFINDIQDGCRE